MQWEDKAWLCLKAGMKPVPISAATPFTWPALHEIFHFVQAGEPRDKRRGSRVSKSRHGSVRPPWVKSQSHHVEQWPHSCFHFLSVLRRQQLAETLHTYPSQIIRLSRATAALSIYVKVCLCGVVANMSTTSLWLCFPLVVIRVQNVFVSKPEISRDGSR